MSRYPKGKNLPAWAGLILCLLMGFVFVCIGTGIEPVEREELKPVTICLERSVALAGDDDRICLQDGEGTWYQLHAANGKYALVRALEELPRGTELELLLHPEDEYVLGIYRDGTPILGWQEAMQEIKHEDLAFSWLGIIMWVLGIVMFAAEKRSKKRK